MKSAVKSVKDGSKGLQSKSKSAYREMKSKMKNSSSHLDAASMIAGGNRHAPLGKQSSNHQQPFPTFNLSFFILISGHTPSSNSAPNSPRGSRAMSFSSASGSESSSNTSANGTGGGGIAHNNNSNNSGGSSFSSASNLQRFATGAESLDMKTNSGTVFLPSSSRGGGGGGGGEPQKSNTLNTKRGQAVDALNFVYKEMIIL